MVRGEDARVLGVVELHVGVDVRDGRGDHPSGLFDDLADLVLVGLGEVAPDAGVARDQRGAGEACDREGQGGALHDGPPSSRHPGAGRRALDGVAGWAQARRYARDRTALKG